MIRVLAVFATLILGGVALLAGGCSLFFTPDVLSSGGLNGIEPVWLTGFALAALAIFLIRVLWRAIARAEARQGTGPDTAGRP